ncbi:MAG: sterol-binding protein [Saprospiraceae bacterium]|nr:MAG: sterol-binding protein [Saprospiraceae bacterium]
MSIEAITSQVKEAVANAPSLGKCLKLQLDTGVVHVDLTGDTGIVTNEDKEADCTIITTEETLIGMKTGAVNPMMAVMSGKIKVKGDMGLAMKLQGLIS